MLLSVEHLTRYIYSTPVRGVVQSHRLMPSAFDGQRVIDWQVLVSDGLKGGAFRDGAGDLVQGWSVQGPVQEIEVRVTGRVETVDLAGVLRGHRELVAPEAYLRDTEATRIDAALAALAEVGMGVENPLSSAHALCDAVSAAIAYRPGATEAKTTAAEALALGEGVCQDHAQAMIAMARHCGLPARYVSGYLLTAGLEAPGEAAHAWAEVHIPGLGWVGFDPANECCPDDRYIRLGSGLDAQDAAPIRGTSRGGSAESLVVAVAVQQAQQ
jgi:transglutaminase-like putative cysteine protease